MKKLFAFLLVLSLVCCACAALADTDKEIQFADHTFGETVEQGLATGVVRSIELNRIPNTPRILVDPIANWNSYAIYGFGNTVTFQIIWEERESKPVGGHESYSYMYYYYPTKEDAAALNLRSGIFYAGYYGFYDNGNAKDTYNDLRTKLATVYGEPFAEGDGDAIFGGPITYVDRSEEAINNLTEDAKRQIQEVSIAAWKSSVNNAMVALVCFNQNGWEQTGIYYIDLDAEAKMLEAFQTEDGSGDGASPDDLGGL